MFLRCARLVERPHVRVRKRKFRCADESIGLLDRGRARDRGGYAGPSDNPGERDFGGLRLAARGDLLQRVENAEPARIEIALHVAAACAFRQVLLLAVFARQKAFGEAEIGDDAYLLLKAKLSESVLE